MTDEVESTARALGGGEPPRSRALLRVGLAVAALAVLYTLTSRAGWEIEMLLKPLHAQLGTPLLVAAVVLYILFLMVPFVPGNEIGLGIIMLFGTQGVIVVYFATILALLLSFLMGRLIPLSAMVRLAGWLHLHGVQRMLAQVDTAQPMESLNRVIQEAPARWVPFLLRHRYVAIGIAFNLPGNVLIGGGGGIGMMAGMSRVFRLDAYLLVLCIATSPVPVVLLTTGTIPLLFA
ncbi:MAG: hypothetical protein HY342_03670 [Candidatus Lambdaproteobacteria bacterium]|nr:hypothetical protein [Candidatus Lambdaproteobacteria bacterium]